MASKSSIAIRRNGAIDRCLEAIQTIWGEDFELPRRHRDMTMLGALQLEAIADYLEYKAAQVEDNQIVVLPDAKIKESQGVYTTTAGAAVGIFVATPLGIVSQEPTEDALPASRPPRKPKTPKIRKSGKRAYPKQ